MTLSQREIANEIRDLAGKLSAEGWDRLRGLRLLQVLALVLEDSRRMAWPEEIGRAETLVDALGEFLHEAPQGKRLTTVLSVSMGLADLVETGRHGTQVDQDMLPVHPEGWLFVLTGGVSEAAPSLAESLAQLGFAVASAESADAAAVACRSNQTILFAGANWLAAQGERLKAWLDEGEMPVLVALADREDFRIQIQARKVGARLLLDAPPDLPSLLMDLAGIAWAPRKAYRVLLVDDDVAALEFHARLLRDSGCEVLTSDDPVAVRDQLDEFAPEACVIDVDMYAGTDLASLLRRHERFAHLPILCLSAFADLEHRIVARHAGGEDYLAKPVDPRLLVAAVLARTRQFRRLDTTYRQHRQAWSHLDSLRTSIDAHAMVSIAAPDGTIIAANARFCAASGYTQAELLGRNHRLIKSGHHTQAYFAEMWQTICQGRIWQGEIKNRRKDGSHYWVQSTIVPILDQPGGFPVRYISLRTDITEQKRIQAERERQVWLLDLLRQALHEFTINQDLKAASGFLLDGMLHLTESAYGFIGEVMHDPEDALYLKSHALANIAWNVDTQHIFEKMQTTGLEFRDFHTLFGAVLHTGESANAPSLNPSGSSEGYPPLHAFLGVPIRNGDALLGMVGLTNRPGGYDADMEALLRPFVVTYAAILEAARLRQYQQQVIADLQQTLDGTERDYHAWSEKLASGSHTLRSLLNDMVGRAQIMLMQEGLGADAREEARMIIKEGKQCAQVISELAAQVQGEALHETQAARPAAALGEARNGRLRILVAEDNLANQAVLRMQLDVLGYTAEIAGDGAVAMARWQAGGHALILADRNMPVMDGLELARAIRAREQGSGAHVPIVAITAVQNPEDLALCLQAGMDDTLPKPIELDDLRRMLERWLSPAPMLAPPRSGVDAAQAASSLAAILDVDYLARIVGNADAKQRRELVDLFTATARTDLPGCRRALDEHDGRSLALAMHKLKSSARMVGALRFAGLAESLEQFGRNGDLFPAAKRLVELERTLDEVEIAVGKLVLAPTVADVAVSGLGPLPRHVLVVDDDPVARRQLGLLLEGLGVEELQVVDDAASALAELAKRDAIDLLISDLNMPGMDGIEFLRRVAVSDYRGDLILFSGVEERLLQTAAEFALAKGLNLRGTLKKPVMRDALLHLLTRPCERVAVASVPDGEVSIEDILDGIRGDEFEVHFQPKVDATTLRLMGVEALARWRRDGRSVSPDSFITLAERHGLIGPLSEVLLTKSLLGGVRLQESGHALSVSVNVSANWLADVHLPEFIMASIQATGFRVENLILEITETGLMSDMTTALDVMSRLRLKGFKLSIDDFGVGYSSLDQLQRFPFGELKLDRSFVRGAAEKPASRAILASTLEMAHSLKLSTVAEGVETQADLDLVRGLGCDMVQGWIVARAMSIDHLLVWMQEREA